MKRAFTRGWTGAARRQRASVASTHSDFTKSFPLQSLKTFAFKDQRRISRDPLGRQCHLGQRREGCDPPRPHRARHGRGHLGPCRRNEGGMAIPCRTAPAHQWTGQG
jgi:hypothetical protein